MDDDGACQIGSCGSGGEGGGRVVYWSANTDQGFAKALGRVYPRVECVGAKAYEKAKRFTHTLFVAERE